MFMRINRVAILALAVPVIATLGPSSVSAGAASATTLPARPALMLEADGEAGTTFIIPGAALAAGASRNHSWNNIPVGFSVFIDARPRATTVTQPCAIEVTREWWTQFWNANNTRSRTHSFTIKNVGSFTCAYDVFQVWVRD
jgi:hypothetical protein